MAVQLILRPAGPEKLHKQGREENRALQVDLTSLFNAKIEIAPEDVLAPQYEKLLEDKKFIRVGKDIVKVVIKTPTGPEGQKSQGRAMRA